LFVATTACKKQAPATPPAPATASVAAAPLPAQASATAEEAPAAKSAISDPCPMPGEDAAACPKAPGKIDDDVQVAHVLVSWDGALPGKVVGRDKAGALKLATEVAHEARKTGADFMALLWKHSSDPGPGVYKVTPDMRRRYVPEFTGMALSLGVGQVDVVESRFGYHVMKRVPFDFVAPDKPLEKLATDACPQAGEDPASCPSTQEPKPAKAVVTHLMIAYTGSIPGKEVTLTKEQAKTKAIELLHAARKQGADFDALVKAHSEFPGPTTVAVTADGRIPPTFRQLALSLGKGQIDAVETENGFHVVKRLPVDEVPEAPLAKVATDPCPQAGEDPASCPSAQTPKPEKTTVMHILIGYKDSLPGENVTRTKDEAKKKAVELLHAARKKGADFAALMKDNSQDPGPGTYPVTPDAGLVPPFKQLSLSLGNGQIDVVETNFGFHVIKRTE
jgi:parvulin-like peptidyl-prolyl isomerase